MIARIVADQRCHAARAAVAANKPGPSNQSRRRQSGEIIVVKKR